MPGYEDDIPTFDTTSKIGKDLQNDAGYQENLKQYLNSDEQPKKTQRLNVASSNVFGDKENQDDNKAIV